jgi:hypothetical protein
VALGSRCENGSGADRQISPKMPELTQKTGVYGKEKSVRHFYASLWVAGELTQIILCSAHQPRDYSSVPF